MEENRNESRKENKERSQNEKWEEMLKSIAEEPSIGEPSAEQIDKRINRRMAAIATRVVAVIFACMAGALLIINPLTKLGPYNMKRMDRVPAEGGLSELEWYLNAYTSMFKPYHEVTNVTVQDRGFGNYTVKIPVVHFGEPTIYGDLGREETYRVSWGRWSAENNASLLVGRSFFAEYMMKTPEEVVPELAELPESGIIYCSLLLGQPVLPETLRKEGIKLYWMAAEQSASTAEAGIAIACCGGIPEDRIRRDEMTGEELRDEFLQELDIVLSDRNMLEQFGIYGSSENGIMVYGDPYAELVKIKEEVEAQSKLHTRKICISGKKQDVLNYIEQLGDVKIHVDDVKLSQWQRVPID